LSCSGENLAEFAAAEKSNRQQEKKFLYSVLARFLKFPEGGINHVENK
jgi:hypothetical protein